MTLFYVYASFVWNTWEFGIAFYFDKPFEFALLLGPISVGFVVGDPIEVPVRNVMVTGDSHSHHGNYGGML